LLNEKLLPFKTFAEILMLFFRNILLEQSVSVITANNIPDVYFYFPPNGLKPPASSRSASAYFRMISSPEI